MQTGWATIKFIILRTSRSHTNITAYTKTPITFNKFFKFQLFDHNRFHNRMTFSLELYVLFNNTQTFLLVLTATNDDSVQICPNASAKELDFFSKFINWSNFSHFRSFSVIFYRFRSCGLWICGIFLLKFDI